MSTYTIDGKTVTVAESEEFAVPLPAPAVDTEGIARRYRLAERFKAAGRYDLYRQLLSEAHELEDGY